MARPVTTIGPLTLQLFALLDGGQWHDQEQVVTELGRHVQPGQAYRAGRAVSQHPQELSDQALIARGRRKTVTALLANQRRIERRVLDGVKQVRLRPAPREGGARGKMGSPRG